MSFLETILAATKVRLEHARTLLTDDVLEQRIAAVSTPLGFARALRSGSPPAVIAEVKRATPSRGALDLTLDAGKLARIYAGAGARAVSVLTEPESFQGSLEDLAAATGCGVPVLRKDFIIDPFQIAESRAWGADAVLLIVRCLGDRLGEMVAATRALGMDALVEVFDESDLERAAAAGADVIGINHRDLETFEVDPTRTERLAPRAPEGSIVVALSGVSERSEIDELVAAGATAVLVGESLVTAADPGAKLAELTS